MEKNQNLLEKIAAETVKQDDHFSMLSAICSLQHCVLTDMLRASDVNKDHEEAVWLLYVLKNSVQYDYEQRNATPNAYLQTKEQTA